MKKKNKLITLGMVSALLTGIILPAATQVSIVYAAEDTETSTANWPNTGGKTLVGSDYSKVNPLDLNENHVFRKDYSATPILQNGSELSLYIKGNKTDIASLPSDGTPGKPKTIKTSQMGEGTYFIASNIMTVLMDGQYQTVDMKVRLLGTDLGTDATSVNFGVKGTEGGGNAFLSIGSGAQVAQRGNFTHMQYQFFKHGTETPVAIKFHMGFTDIDFNEALKIDENVVDKVYIDKKSILPYEIKDGKLAITRDYNDISDKKDPMTTPKGQTHVVLFDINAPASGFNISIASSGHSNNDANAITQGSKVAPSILATMLYSGTVTSKYVDEAGNEIAAPQTSSDTIGKDYTTTKSEELTKDGVTYVLVPEKLPENATGKYVDGNIDVIYIYKKKDPVAGGNVTAKYVDENGNTISDDVVKSGNIGDDYSTDQKAIPGYTFKAVQGNPTGQFTSDAQTVTYVYTKDPVAGGNVTAKYVDENGNTISDDVVKNGNVGDDYSTDQKAIPGYTFKAVQGNPTGQFTSDAQTVTYVYTKEIQHNVASGSSSTNVSYKKLPKTGEDSSTWILIIGGGLLALVGIIIYKRKKT